MVYVKMMSRVNTYPICDSPLWRSTRRGAARLRYRNRAKITVLMCERMPCPVWSSCQHKTCYPIWFEHSVGRELQGLVCYRGSSSIVREIEDYVLFVLLYKVGKPGCSSANLVDPNSQVLNVTNHLNCNSL